MKTAGEMNVCMCVCVFQGYDNTESSVRKASVFCLVAIYSVIGEDLKPHLQQLTGSKVRYYLYGSLLQCILGFPLLPLKKH